MSAILVSTSRPEEAPRTLERRFHLGMALALLGAMFLGFARTFFLKPWFTEWAAAHAAPEPILALHGAVFTGWFVLLPVQAWLIGARRVDLHRRLGAVGAGLAVVMVVLGTAVSLVAARRPTGFMDVPLPPLQFLAIPLANLATFAAFAAFGLMARRTLPTHKRLMLLASIALVEAAVGRWPFAFVAGASFVPYLDAGSLVTDLFLVPLFVHDVATRGRVHPVTLWGAAALVASQAVRLPLAQTAAWLSFAGWAVGRLGP